GQTFKEGDGQCIVALLEELEKLDAKILVEEQFHRLIGDLVGDRVHGTFSPSNGLDADFDMFVSFGGDGTMLRAVTYIKDLGIPIVGVNTGRLGFLSTIKKEDVRKLVTEFVVGHYTIEKRALVVEEIIFDLDVFNVINLALNEVK